MLNKVFIFLTNSHRLVTRLKMTRHNVLYYKQLVFKCRILSIENEDLLVEHVRNKNRCGQSMNRAEITEVALRMVKVRDHLWSSSRIGNPISNPAKSFFKRKRSVHSYGRYHYKCNSYNHSFFILYYAGTYIQACTHLMICRSMMSNFSSICNCNNICYYKGFMIFLSMLYICITVCTMFIFDFGHQILVKVLAEV